MPRSTSSFACAVGVGVFAVASLVACAEGMVDDAEVGTFASTPSEAGSDSGSRLPPPSNPPSGDNDAGDKKDSGGGGGTDAGTDSGGGGTCTAANACAGATDLGEVSGDTGAETATAQGSTSQWIVVRVTEDYHDLDGVSLRMSASLASPPGTNFDLYIYQPSTGRECSAVKTQSTTSGTSDTASVEFGESGLFSNGETDTRNVTIEVRHVSGPCNPSAKWTLTVNGN